MCLHFVTTLSTHKKPHTHTAAALEEKGAVHQANGAVPVETDSDDMLFTQTEAGIYQVRAASLDRLLERMTWDRVTNAAEDISAFVLHYDKFLTAEALMGKLAERFRTVCLMILMVV